MPLRIQVVTPERELTVAEDVTFVLAHGIEGDVGILAGHAPLLIALGVGPLELEREGGARERMLVDGGFLQVKDDSVIVLAEYAVLPSEIDASAVNQEVDELRRRLEAEHEDEEAKRALARVEGMRKLLQVG